MRRLSAVALLLLLAGCNAVQVTGIFDPGVVVISGVVSGVHLTVTDGNVLITVVTLQPVGGASATTSPFCGDHVRQFPTGSTVEVSFRPGQTCAALVTVTIH